MLRVVAISGSFAVSGARGLLITGWPNQGTGDDGFEACVP
jgi:hypothetical protein